MRRERGAIGRGSSGNSSSRRALSAHSGPLPHYFHRARARGGNKRKAPLIKYQNRWGASSLLECPLSRSPSRVLIACSRLREPPPGDMLLLRAHRARIYAKDFRGGASEASSISILSPGLRAHRNRRFHARFKSRGRIFALREPPRRAASRVTPYLQFSLSPDKCLLAPADVLSADSRARPL